MLKPISAGPKIIDDHLLWTQEFQNENSRRLIITAFVQDCTYEKTRQHSYTQYDIKFH